MRNLGQRHSATARRNGDCFELRDVGTLVRGKAEDDADLLVAFKIGCYGVAADLSL